MNFSVSRLLGSIPSQEAAGWGTSVAVHAIGVLVASATFVSLSGELPELAGHRTVANVELTATWKVEKPQPPEPVEIVPVEPQVVVMPDRVRMAEQTYVPTSTDVTQPTPAELVMVDRMMVAPPKTPPRKTAVSPTPPDERAASRPSRNPPPAQFPTREIRPTVGTKADSPPRLLDNRPPTYPAHAARERLEGTTLLRVRITAEGTVAELELISTSGHSVLDAAAVRAVRTWRFQPAMRGGRPAATTVRLPVRFALDER
ncbi:MAG TPA: energy transducer TonB [Thermoguttaceae bacterium]|nr:energy transducer TonB [Thermoguttaceae bacterium]